ncbi:acetyltransferase (GNAT) family protein [Nonomuraea polychroma]|uniref:Acetyltransferase (GNAT) family protein n=1 Tax=Nonomuraea polychroma TaxID=46176 RepID=A0A438MLA3_9ACTN|nr:GNAT family N-acetyltransferase [Nonomuraea polychroma]RVX46376.1 acetyltransferase (GNAT) family protein [Nonomuraea polychroma]
MLVIEERTAEDDELAALLDAAFEELVVRYGREGRSQVQAGARYLVASVDGRAVGCGAVQPVDARTGEVKRMYVVPGSRGQGIAKALLSALEDLACELGYRRLRLATGVRQPEAIALYERCAYTLTEPYGKYVDAPLTRCYQKALAQ